MSKYTGYCMKKCRKYYNLPPAFDERKHFGKCPDCGLQLTLDRHSMEENKKLLGLSVREIGEKVAGLINYK